MHIYVRLCRLGADSTPSRHHVVGVFGKFGLGGVFGRGGESGRFERRIIRPERVPQTTLPSPTMRRGYPDVLRESRPARSRTRQRRRYRWAHRPRSGGPASPARARGVARQAPAQFEGAHPLLVLELSLVPIVANPEVNREVADANPQECQHEAEHFVDRWSYPWFTSV